MFVKLLIIIIVVGAMACALLVNRQQRIDTAHEIAAVHQRLIAQEQTLWRLRMEIAQRVKPEYIKKRIDRAGGMWVSIPSRPRSSHRPAFTIALFDLVMPDEEDLGG